MHTSFYNRAPHHKILEPPDTCIAMKLAGPLTESQGKSRKDKESQGKSQGKSRKSKKSRKVKESQGKSRKVKESQGKSRGLFFVYGHGCKNCFLIPRQMFFFNAVLLRNVLIHY